MIFIDLLSELRKVIAPGYDIDAVRAKNLARAQAIKKAQVKKKFCKKKLQKLILMLKRSVDRIFLKVQ